MNTSFKKFLIILIAAVLVGVCFGIGGILVWKKIEAKKNIQAEPVINQEKTEPIIENISAPQEETVQQQDIANSEPEKKEEPKEEINFSFAIVGDTQRFNPNNPSGNLAQASKNIEEQDVKFILALGDLTSSCDESKDCKNKLTKWKALFKETIYPVQGNHDRTGEKKSDTVWQNFFDLPKNGPTGFSELVYSFDYANSHFVALDSDNPEEFLVNNTQRTWIEEDLAKNKQKNIFVFYHEPAYPANSKIRESLDKNPKERDALWAIFKKYKVTAVFSGHEHINFRRKTDGIYQFVFGNTDSFDHLAPKSNMAEYSYVGANYGIVEVINNTVTVKVFSVDGVLLNSFTIPSVAT